MENRLFSLLIVPDSGEDIKTGSFNYKFILGFFSTLVVLFFICLFFIVGYHIKLSQEKNYKIAVNTHKNLLKHINQSQKLYNTLSEKLAKIQHNDNAFRNFNRMKILDSEMYKAGIGGHVIVDNSDYRVLGKDLQIELEELDYGITTLGERIDVIDNSLEKIQIEVRKNREIFNNTPTIFPTYSIRFTSGYNMRRHPLTGRWHFHTAVDLAGYRGQSIFTTADGIVTSAKRTGLLGRCIKIKHGYGYETLYGHLNKIKVKVGQKVRKGDIIGEMGRSGRTTGVHVHYSISLNKRAVNPMDYFK